MSQKKKAIRARFREEVFARDGYKCAVCGYKPRPDRVQQELDAHHIQDRNDLPNGGYVKGNGISLCHPCHEKAEQLHRSGVAAPGYTREELYAKIGSSYEQALRASERLND